MRKEILISIEGDEDWKIYKEIIKKMIWSIEEFKENIKINTNFNTKEKKEIIFKDQIKNSLWVYKKSLINKDFIFYINEEEWDSNGNTIMKDIKTWKIISNNYFANTAFIEDAQSWNFDWMSENTKYNMREYNKEEEEEENINYCIAANSLDQTILSWEITDKIEAEEFCINTIEKKEKENLIYPFERILITDWKKFMKFIEKYWIIDLDWWNGNKKLKITILNKKIYKEILKHWKKQ